jgi:hypothetical protein
VFQKDRARLILPPTNSVQLAQRALADIPVGGKTPLSAGLFLAYQVIRREKFTHPDVEPLLILLTDGAGNVSISDQNPQVEAHNIAEQIAGEEIRSVVINMEHAAFDQGLAQALAHHLKGPCYTLSELKRESQDRAQRSGVVEIGSPLFEHPGDSICPPTIPSTNSKFSKSPKGSRAKVRACCLPQTPPLSRGLISFEIQPGEVVGFGPNGGKNHHPEMLSGLLHPTGGRISVLG